MKKKTKIILTASTLAILSLMVTVQQLQPQTQPEPTDIPPCRALCRWIGITPHPQKAKPLLRTEAPKSAPKTHHRTTPAQKPILSRRPQLTARNL